MYEVIRGTIESVLRKYGIQSDVNLVNHGRTVSVNDNGLIFWVRMLPREDKLNVEFSTVQLPKDLQRRGIFTDVFNTIKSLDFINRLSVDGICTSAMSGWSIKHNLESNGFSCWVYPNQSN